MIVKGSVVLLVSADSPCLIFFFLPPFQHLIKIPAYRGRASQPKKETGDIDPCTGSQLTLQQITNPQAQQSGCDQGKPQLCQKRTIGSAGKLPLFSTNEIA